MYTYNHRTHSCLTQVGTYLASSVPVTPHVRLDRYCTTCRHFFPISAHEDTHYTPAEGTLAGASGPPVCTPLIHRQEVDKNTELYLGLRVYAIFDRIYVYTHSLSTSLSFFVVSAINYVIVTELIASNIDTVVQRRLVMSGYNRRMDELTES